jgi:hypothetical protein
LAFPALNPIALAASVVGVFDTPIADRKPEDEVAAKVEYYVADLFRLVRESSRLQQPKAPGAAEPGLIVTVCVSRVRRRVRG